MNSEPVPPADDPNLSDLGRAMLGGGGSGGGSGSKPSGPWLPPTPEELQALLPQYVILAMLGRGGMGAVYMGRQISLDRSVAIKILSGALEDSDLGFKERFKNEARAMARLSHPGIVAVHDFGETNSGLLYIVMEYVDGTDVSRMIAADGRLHSEHAMAIAAHVCDALAYAHERGIIHRDIKPANIMVGYDGIVKVADFGLAKVHSDSGQTLGLTMSGMAMGTMHYIAPEALEDGAVVDQRADLYAVGVMLYQMLTGKLPKGIFELPSMQVAGLDPRYDGIIAKAMREDREARYRTARELRGDLDAILTQPVAKVEADQVTREVPAALPTMARPQHPGGKPMHRLERPKSASAPSGIKWLGAVAIAAIFATGGYFLITKRGKEEAAAKAPPTLATKSPAPPSAVSNFPANALTFDDAFMKTHVVGTTWRTRYTNDPRHDLLEFRSGGNEVVKTASMGGEQTGRWSIAEDGRSLKIDTLDGSGFFFTIAFTSPTEGSVEFSKVPPAKMVGSIVRVEEASGATEAVPVPVTTDPAGESGEVRPEDATKDRPFTNTLGMKFVPVPIGGGPTAGQRVLFSVWETRVQDFETFSKETGHSWSMLSNIEQGPTHAVAGIKWEDAQAFTQWLSEKERSLGTLPEGARYRLPSDEEWSWAVGLPHEPGSTPKEKQIKNDVEFPWGRLWPPPNRVGNYDEKTLDGYEDGFAGIAPVGSFPPNVHGLHDMGGNLYEWCEDWYDDTRQSHVLRGTSYVHSQRNFLLSSNRGTPPATPRLHTYGFRCVLDLAYTAGGVGPENPLPASAPSTSIASATLWIDAKGRTLDYRGTEWPPRQSRMVNYSDKLYKAFFPEANAIEGGLGNEDDHALIAPVASYPPNELGLHDLDRNVWEWCFDLYDDPNGSKGLARGSYWAAFTPGQLLVSPRQTGGVGTPEKSSPEASR